MSFTLDTSEFAKAMQFVVETTKKDSAEVLNRAALHVIIGGKGVRGAMQRTPKADKAKIKTTLERSVGGKKASEGARIYRNQYGTFSRRTTRTKGAAGDSMLKFLALKILKRRTSGNPSNEAIESMMKKIMASRMRAAGYTAFAGWNKAAQAFGGKGLRGIDQKRFGKSEARKGSGTKAKKESLAAEIENTTPVAAKIGLAPLQAAIKDVARDMVEYANRKLQKTFDKVNR